MKINWFQLVQGVDKKVVGISKPCALTHNDAACWDWYLQIVKSIYHCNWVGLKCTNPEELFATSNTCTNPDIMQLGCNGYLIEGLFPHEISTF